MRLSHWHSVLACVTICALLACGDDDANSSEGGGATGGGGAGGEGGGGTPSPEPDSGAMVDGGSRTLCAKYGGPDEVAAMVMPILGAISGDCRVNSFFAPLPMTKINHIAECMVIQLSELFGCPGFKYEGSKDSSGDPCIDMVTAHATLDISEGDFSALVEDMADGLMEAGVSASDIAMVAPAITGLKPDIVRNDAADPTQAMCDDPDGGT